MTKFKSLISSPTKTKTGIFFDSTKYNVIVQSVEPPTEEGKTYQPSEDAMEVDQDDSDDDEDHFNVKAFEEVLRNQQSVKTNHLMEAIQLFVEKEHTSFLQVLCFLGQRHFYKIKGQRKLAAVFKNLAEKGENYFEPNEITINQAVAAKQALNLSRRGYGTMKKLFAGKVTMPSSDKVSQQENALTPKATPYLDGVKYDLKECLSRTVERIFGILHLEEIPKEITVKGVLGEDGSGGHVQRRGKDIDIPTSNRIVAGFRLSRIYSGEKLLHQEKSQGPESERAFMLVPGKESAELVRQIWQDISKEFEEAKHSTVTFKDSTIEVTFDFGIQGDGKVRIQLTGLGGAFCILCFCTEEDANDIDKIEEGFPIQRSLEQIWEKLNELTRGLTQEIKRETRDYATRLGHTQFAMLPPECKLNPIGTAELHFILHLFGYYKELFQNMKARLILGRLAVRGSKGRGNKIDATDEAALKEAMDYFTQKVREQPLSLLINAPDPHGHGGSVENGNTCRIFLDPKNREAVIAIFSEVATEDEQKALPLFFQEGYVIYHVANAIGEIHVEMFKEYVHNAYIHWKRAFPYQKIPNSIHWNLGHLGELSELNDGFATGELSEGSLESIMKILRRYETTLARNTSFVDNATDCLKRIWLQGDPELRLHKPKPKPRRNKFVSDDDKLVKSFFK